MRILVPYIGTHPSSSEAVDYTVLLAQVIDVVDAREPELGELHDQRYSSIVVNVSRWDLYDPKQVPPNAVRTTELSFPDIEMLRKVITVLKVPNPRELKGRTINVLFEGDKIIGFVPDLESVVLEK